MELQCQACGYRETVDVPAMLEHLHRLGMFKRQRDPEPYLVAQLFADQLPLLPCPACGHVGRNQAAAEQLDDETWGGGRTCEVCRQPIPAERLEVFPDTRRCTKCQQLADRGEDAAEPEYCPRCGAVMQLRLRGGETLTRYVMHCSDCGYRH